MIDASAPDLELEVGNRTFNLRQSSGLLNSNRASGTTGAVLWKVTPLVAQWLIDKENVLWRQGVLNSSSVVIELGCGISGVIGLALHRHVRKYVLSDQTYVMKTLNQNIAENVKPERKKGGKKPNVSAATENLQLLSFDWEQDSTESFKKVIGSPTYGTDLVVACDCIYNDFLIVPFVQACRDICQLRRVNENQPPTVLLVAQQQRAAEVFESWLREALKYFRIWRVPDSWLADGLKSGSGYVVHIAFLMDPS